jgi:CIC family chloride channel protein
MGKWIGLATFIGIGGGLAAVGFDWLVELLKEGSLHRAADFHGEGIGSEGGGLGPLLARTWPILVILPLGGLLVGWLTQRFAPEAEGHGTEQMILTFHKGEGRVRKRVAALKALTSAITIGTGGSAGQEGPVAQIGSSIGSSSATALGLGDRDRRLFLLTGASAGVGALFTAPLAGALFAPEVLYRRPEFEGDAIIPCIISSIVAYTTYSGITGETKAIHIADHVLDGLTHQDARHLPIYLLLALLCTLVSFVYVRTFNGTNKLLKAASWLPGTARPAVGGLALAVLAIALAPLCGSQGVLYGGYDLMKGSIATELAIGTMAILVVGKILATSFSIASGGSGGVFAPSLAIGALLGAIVGQTAVALFPDLGVNPGSFALVGMGGFFAGVAKTPITSVIIVSEMTGSYGLLLPLMLVAVVHLMLARGWGIYDTQVPGPADSPAHFGDFVVDVLEKMRVDEVVDYDSELPRVNHNATLRKALDIVSGAVGSYFPVVDGDDRLVGIFSLSDIRRIFRETDVQDLVIVRDFMVEDVATVRAGDSLNAALRLMNQLAIHQIPVVAEADDRHVIGMLTRNNLGAAYHQRLRDLRRG